jgi:hypothetical protein
MAEREFHTKPGRLVLDAQASENWKKFLMAFEIYLVASEKDRKSEKLKVNLLLNCAGAEAIEEYSHFVYNEGESAECFKDICKKFEELCKGERNVIYERLVFNQRNQKEGERMDNFVSELKRLSLTCEFGELRDSLIRDRIVGGVLSDELRGELLKKPGLTLQSAHDYCRTYEASEAQKCRFGKFTGGISNVSPVIQESGLKPKDKKYIQPLCKFCALKHSFSNPANCPAYKKRCRKCQKEGHFARVCVKKNSRVDVVHKNASDEENDLDNGVHAYFTSIEIECLSNKKRSKQSMINVKIGKQNVRMKADTGAEATVIPYHLYQKITRKPLQKIHQPLKGWLATKPIHPRGCVRLPTEYEGRKLDLLYLVVEGDFTPLLGCDACLDLEVLKFMNFGLLDIPESDNEFEKVERKDNGNIFVSSSILKEYQDCFSEKPGILPNPVHLEMYTSVTPVIHAPRKIPIALLDPTKEKLKEMEDEGVIVKEEGHTPWVSSMLMVDKRKGTKTLGKKETPSKADIRICIDPRDLNRALKWVHHPMVTVEEVANRLSGARVFTSIDACSGFWQLPVDEESSKLLTFNTPWGRYRFTRLPFGITPAPEIY